MTKHMQRDLDRLHDLVLNMAGCVEGAIFHAIRALRERNPAESQQVMAGDTEIDLLENRIQEEALAILALHHPVASDLRRIASVLFICTDLERMGDLAVDLAERAAVLSRPPHFPLSDRFEPMAAQVTAMVRQALDAFVQVDAEAARDVVRLDLQVNEHHRRIIDEIAEAMKADPSRIDAGISMFSVVRHLERIADHATNIAEGVVFLVEGNIVRHHPEAFDKRSSA